MFIKIKRLLIIVPLILTAFTPAERNKAETGTYYNMRFLKQSSAPRIMKLIKTDNIAYNKQILLKGILFSYKNRTAGSVKIAGDFSRWKDIRMEKGQYGVWHYFLSDCDKKKIRYKLMVDSIWINDPQNMDNEDDGYGSYVSVVYPVMKSREHMVSYKFVTKNTVQFRIYQPDAHLIAIVGDFNNWNPENDLLTKNENGLWSLIKKLPNGIYKYNYIIDGKWSVDLYNEKSASDDVGGICSVIEVR